jgi:3-phosphoshikimate 1-carboxyvinyltransferase
MLKQPIADLPPVLELPAPARSFDASVQPPGSKSLTNRALLLAGLAQGRSVIHNPLRSGDDSRIMLDALATLGVGIEEGTGNSLIINGVDGRWRSPASGVRLSLGNAGTAARFLGASAMLAPGPITIDGTARMRERPIGELGSALASLQCGVTYLEKQGFPPVELTPPPAGSQLPAIVELPTTQSSQFPSGLLMIGPWLPRGLTLRLFGEITSAPYVEMTLGLLARAGASVRSSEDLHLIRIGPGAEQSRGIPGFEYTVEPDASGATYFWAGAAIVPGAACRVMELRNDSLQGDSRFPEVLGLMGVKVARVADEETFIETVGPPTLRPILADMASMPDAAMTLASVACFASGTSILRGLRTLHVKECDRIAAMKTELTKLGIKVQTPVHNDPDAMTITPPPGGLDCSASAPPIVFDTYDDHRMAMSLALIALRRPNISIRNPACVAKTYPTFWQDFAKLYE